MSGANQRQNGDGKLESSLPTITSLLRAARGRRTQETWAQALAVTRATIIKWESGESIPDDARLLDLSFHPDPAIAKMALDILAIKYRESLELQRSRMRDAALPSSKPAMQL